MQTLSGCESLIRLVKGRLHDTAVLTATARNFDGVWRRNQMH